MAKFYPAITVFLLMQILLAPDRMPSSMAVKPKPQKSGFKFVIQQEGKTYFMTTVSMSYNAGVEKCKSRNMVPAKVSNHTFATSLQKASYQESFRYSKYVGATMLTNSLRAAQFDDGSIINEELLRSTTEKHDPRIAYCVVLAFGLGGALHLTDCSNKGPILCQI